MELHITLLPGDGIGPEVMQQAIKILKIIENKYHHTFHTQEELIGACAIDKTGSALPQKTIATCLKSDAVLLACIGDPKYDNDPSAPVRPEQGLLKIRQELQLFSNIRPIEFFSSLKHFSPLKEKIIDKSNFIIVRELTGGIYFGEKTLSDDKTQATDICTYSKKEIERITHIAFEYAKKRNKKVTLVDKANVLETSRLWRKVVKEIQQEKYQDIALEFLFVDNAAMKIIQSPKDFDVLLTENMFGDILSDEASVITGSLGLLPSASLGEKYCLFEPVHGSYPQATGKNIANPLAMLLSLKMFFEHFNLLDEAKVIHDAIEESLKENIVTEDLSPSKSYTTSQVGDSIAEYISSSV